MIKKYIKPELVIPCIILILLSYILIFNPIIGKHNNGDFGRTIFNSGLSDISLKYEDIYDNFVHSKYKVSISYFLPWGFDWTSEVLLIKAAVFLNVICLNTIVDIRFLSMIYIIIFTFSIFLIIKYFNKANNSPIFKWILGIFILLIFTDIGYISYFNSFFGEETSFIFLFLTIGSAMYLVSNEKPTKFQVTFFMISSMFFLTAKQQNIPLIVFMCIFYFRIYLLLSKDKSYKKLLLILISISIFLSFLSYISIGKTTTICNKYQSVFYGIIKDSPTPEEDLEFMGIDKSFSVLKNTLFYTKGLPINPMDESLDSTLYNKISSFKLLNFYLQHPQRLYAKMIETSLYSFDYFQIDKGNYEKGEYDKSNKIYNVFRTWISVKYQNIFRNLFNIFIFTLLYFLVLLFNYIRSKDKFKKAYIELLIIIGLIGSSQYILPIIGSGSGDLAKHLFLLNLSYDIMFVIAFMWILMNLYRIFNKIRSKFLRLTIGE